MDLVGLGPTTHHHAYESRNHVTAVSKRKAHIYSRRATTPKTAARPAPAPVAALMAPALKAGWEAAGVETVVPVAATLEGTRGVEVTEETGVEELGGVRN